MSSFTVQSPDVAYLDEEIVSMFTARSCRVEGTRVIPREDIYTFKTQRKVPKLGMMLVGWGGNNGTTITAGILANKESINWQTKDGELTPNYYGSLTQSSTVRIGVNEETGHPVFVPFRELLPMVNPNDLVISGWDISSMNIGDAMKRAKVLDYDLQQRLYPRLKEMQPLPSIYNESFIASNQGERADHVIAGGRQDQLEQIRRDIREFKANNSLDKVIVLWTATTERFSQVLPGIHDTADHLLAAIAADHKEISPSAIFAVAALLEDCSFINGSPQNTFVPGVVDLSERKIREGKTVFLAGNDFKTGQTKLKSVLVDYLVSAGIKPTSIVSYNHLGNNDGRNLSEPEQFKSKETSKTTVIDDMIEANRLLYREGEAPDHCVVIKYVPAVGDSKRAMDEYTSEIFLHGKNTLVIHNTCEDSLLAAPLIIDLVILAEICERIKIRREPEGEFEAFHPILSLLGYLMKAPAVPYPGAPVVNALNAQRQAIVNIFKAAAGLPADDFMDLHTRLPSLLPTNRKRKLESSFLEEDAKTDSSSKTSRAGEGNLGN